MREKTFYSLQKRHVLFDTIISTGHYLAAKGETFLHIPINHQPSLPTSAFMFTVVMFGPLVVLLSLSVAAIVLFLFYVLVLRGGWLLV